MKMLTVGLLSALVWAGSAQAETYEMRMKVEGMKAPIKEQPSCLDWLSQGETQSGNYRIKPEGASESFEAYCDMTTNGGGWTRIGQRKNYTSGSGSRQVLIKDLIQVIPNYTEVRQPGFEIRDCSGCSANSWDVWNENGGKISQGSGLEMNGSSYRTVANSSSSLIYEASWSGMSGGSHDNVDDGVGHDPALSGYVYVK